MKKEMEISVKYRPEIDGLRAVAVVSVITYHLNTSWLPGGYLGVDIFFVISGYLITSIIFNNLINDSFSFKNFWIRRIKRILPALIVMVSIVFVVAAIILIRPERGSIPLQSLATIFSFNNIILWKTTGGYWAASSENFPLLHTWSLSVEEQFYLCFPFILYYLVKFKKDKALIYIIFVLLLSIGLYVYGVKYHSSAAFYLLPTRMWELLVGSSLALLPRCKQFLKKQINPNFLSFIGFIFLFFSFFKIFPIQSSFYNLLACVGTFLIIQNAYKRGLVYNFLKLRPIVDIGKISYSLYLWHWPVIVFSKYLDTEMNYVLVVSIIVGCSVLSYFFIEKPIRYGSIRIKHALTPVPIISVICIFIYTVYPTSPLVASLGNIDTDEALTRGWEFEARKQIRNGKIGLVFNEEDTGRNRPIVVLGSSHARVLCKPIKKIADDLRVPFVSMSTSGIGIMSDTPTKTRPNADVINKKRFENIAKIKPSLLVVGGMWSSEINTDNFEMKFKEKLQQLSEYSDRVLIVGQVPLIELPQGYKNAMRKYLVAKNNSDDINHVKSSIKVHEANRLIEKAVNELNSNNIRFVNPYGLFTGEEGEVIFLKDGKFLYSDYNHVNDMGASLIVNNLLCQHIYAGN